MIPRALVVLFGAFVSLCWAHGTHAQLADSPHAAAPLPRLSSDFGERSDPLTGRVRLHAGVDIAAPLGTPVYAAAAGEVRFAASAGGYGQMVEIDHGGGLRSRYAHLSRILVTAGEMVMQGQTIATIGSTGRSTGNHLHFEIRRHGTPVDPLALLAGPARSAAIGHAPIESFAPHISAYARASRSAEPGQ